MIVPSAIFADVMRLAAVAVVPVAASAQIAPTAIVLVLFMDGPFGPCVRMSRRVLWPLTKRASASESDG